MKGAEFCEYPEFEVDKISVSKSDGYCCPQSIIEAFDEPLGNSFDEVVGALRETFSVPVYPGQVSEPGIM